MAWLVAGAAALSNFARGDTTAAAPAAASAQTPATQTAGAATAPTPVDPQVSATPTATATAVAPTTTSPAVAVPTTTDQATTPPAVMASAPLSPAVALPDPIPGDSVTSVLAAMGKPNGVITLPDKYLMMFDRGNIVMSLQDVVLESKLMPLPVYTAKLAEQVAEENDRNNARARANALLDLLLNDPSYVAMSTRDRLLALARFDREHPGSDAHQDYLDLLAVYAAEQATSAKVVELQGQAADARAQAIYAQQQAASIQQQLLLAQQQTAAAQAQAAAAQRQAVIVQQSNAGGVVGPNGPILRTGNGIAIGGGGIPTQKPPPPTIINNNSITNVPPQGVEVILPNGTIKFIPGNTTSGGNHTTYF